MSSVSRICGALVPASCFVAVFAAAAPGHAEPAAAPAPTTAPDGPEPDSTDAPPEPAAEPVDAEAGPVDEPVSPQETPAAPPSGLVPPALQAPYELAYPESLLQQEVPPEGQVTMLFVIGVDGRAKGIRVETSVDRALDLIAVEAVARAVWTPATYEGAAVEIETTEVFDFTAPEIEPEPAVVPVTDPAAESATEPGIEETEPAQADLPVRIRGVLLEGGKRQAVPGASVLAVPGDGLDTGDVRPRTAKKWQEQNPSAAWTIETTTAEDGSFELRGVPAGRVLVIFLTQGYERLDYVVDVDEKSVVEGKYYQTRLNTNPYRTVVETDRGKPAEITRREITTEEVTKVPGTQGDPLKAVQNFPGIARSPFGAGLLIIRGASPGDSAVYLGGHELPQLFHFGGLTSIFNADLVGDIGYLPSNFGSEYGDATGGVISVSPKETRRDGVHGYVDADVIDASALVTGPVGKGRFAAGVRRSYLDLVLRPLDAVPLAPRYWDYQGTFAYPVGPGELGVRAFGSHDEFVTLSDTGSGFDFSQSFHRGDLFYKQRTGKWDIFVSPSFLYNDVNITQSNTQTYTMSLRAEATLTANPVFSTTFGTESKAGRSDVDLLFGGSGIGALQGGPQSQGSTSKTPFVIPAVYSTSNVRLGKDRPVTLSPGVRFTAYATPMGKVATDPRLNASWQASSKWTVKAGVGLYSQAPGFLELDEVFGNPDLDPERSMQATLSAAYDLPLDMAVELTGFYKYLWDMASPSSELVEREGQTVPELYANTGVGHSYGGEVLLRRDFSKKIYGWMAYTLSRTELQEKPGDEFFIAGFDQSHILNLVAGYKLPRNWNIGIRFRVTSGNPTTPQANGIYDSSSDEYRPFEAPFRSDRLPAFHQLDFRVDKTWTMDLVRVLLYLDIQNLYNAKNAEFQTFSYDYRQSARVNSLPILPSLGLRLDF